MSICKGILLAGGFGSRLKPATLTLSKHLLNVYDKPMIYYSLSLLMLAGIKDILVLCTKQDYYSYQNLLADGSQWGINISYKIQNSPDGIAQSFILAQDFIENHNVSLALGDNILYGSGLSSLLNQARQQNSGATVFGYLVKNPSRYGVVNFSNEGYPIEIEEKPQNPKSNCALIGLYFYDNKVVDYAKSLRPSNRGELEITDINRIYLQNNALNIKILGRGVAWFDTGTPKSLLDAANFFYSLEDRQGMKVYCPEEIALRYGYIDEIQYMHLIKNLGDNEYSLYLRSLLDTNNSYKNSVSNKKQNENYYDFAHEELI